jgi:hypothetical protein
MKTFFAPTALLVVIFTLAACSSASPDDPEPSDDETNQGEVQANDPGVATKEVEIPPKKQKNPG